MIDNKVLLSFEEFEESMLFIKSMDVKEGEINKKFSEWFDCSSIFLYSEYQTAYINLLKKLMGDLNEEKNDYSWIEYFIYELDWGERAKDHPCVWEEDGETPIPMATLRDLYNFLLKEGGCSHEGL